MLAINTDDVRLFVALTLHPRPRFAKAFTTAELRDACEAAVKTAERVAESSRRFNKRFAGRPFITAAELCSDWDDPDADTDGEPVPLG